MMSANTPLISDEFDRFENLLKQFIQGLDAEPSADAAHDVQHITRVVKTARALCAQIEGGSEGPCDAWVVVPAAYLHDCVSLPKDHPNRHKGSSMAADKAVGFLESIDFSCEKLPAIHHAIVAHSFSAGVRPQTIEAKVVQDADRLDALGAIGITRCIQVGTALNRQLYSLYDPFCKTRAPDDGVYTLDHFYTKLFHLRDSLQTEASKQEADARIAFMQSFLAQLDKEIC